jgi:hypothetical protein
MAFSLPYFDVRFVGAILVKARPKRNISATIVADVKRFSHQINTDDVFGTHSSFLPKILQRGSYAPIAAQGRADPACRPDCRPHAGDARAHDRKKSILQDHGRHPSEAQSARTILRLNFFSNDMSCLCC